MAYPTMDALLVRPVEAGMWRLHETFDGTYIIDDLMDACEMLDVKEANQMRHAQWKAEQQRPR